MNISEINAMDDRQFKQLLNDLDHRKIKFEVWPIADERLNGGKKQLLRSHISEKIPLVGFWINPFVRTLPILAFFAAAVSLHHWQIYILLALFVSLVFCIVAFVRRPKALPMALGWLLYQNDIGDLDVLLRIFAFSHKNPSFRQPNNSIISKYLSNVRKQGARLDAKTTCLLASWLPVKMRRDQEPFLLEILQTISLCGDRKGATRVLSLARSPFVLQGDYRKALLETAEAMRR